VDSLARGGVQIREIRRRGVAEAARTGGELAELEETRAYTNAGGRHLHHTGLGELVDEAVNRRLR